jgi:hypothetical protein
MTDIPDWAYLAASERVNKAGNNIDAIVKIMAQLISQTEEDPAKERLHREAVEVAAKYNESLGFDFTAEAIREGRTEDYEDEIQVALAGIKRGLELAAERGA